MRVKDRTHPSRTKTSCTTVSQRNWVLHLGTIINLYAEFYHIPKDEPKTKNQREARKEKNA